MQNERPEAVEAVARALHSLHVRQINRHELATLSDDEVQAKVDANWPYAKHDYYPQAQAALAAARAAHFENQWQPIETAPADENILAAVKVINNKTGESWWEQHTIVIDSETGEIGPDNDAGWGLSEYTHWQPLPAPPRTSGAAK